jgi:cysteine desulfurase
LFHTDAVQAFGKLKIDMKSENIDLLSISGHKLYCVKGIGALCINPDKFINVLYKNNKFNPRNYLQPLLYGGSHEFSIRPSTENTPGIVGLGTATELAYKNLLHNSQNMKKLLDYLTDRLLNEIPNSFLNGSRDNRLYNNCNIRFAGIDGFDLMLKLDANQIACSTGSACSTKSTKPSRVLTALGLSDTEASSSIRLTLGKYTTKDQLDYVIKTIILSVKQLRAMAK